MFDTFFPDAVMNSTYDIDFDQLYKDGYRGLIFDIDNTLVPHGAPADDRAKALFSHLKELGYDICLLSNNQLPRVEMFNKDVQVHFKARIGVTVIPKLADIGELPRSEKKSKRIFDNRYSCCVKIP